MYKWLPLASKADLSQLASVLPPEYVPSVVVKKLISGISDGVKAVLVEQNYADKDYRSTYYNFYAKKGQRYRLDCVRLHFFDGNVKFDPSTLKLICPEGQDSLSDHYFGFMVLRPTGIATIGRSVLSPDVRSGANRFIITAAHKVHLLGYRLKVEGFPSMDQHIDISVCAHAACWSILRHNSAKYNIYQEFLTHDITLMAHQFDPGGLVPSKGLQVSHAERVFQEAGTFPVHVTRDKNKTSDESFFRQLGAYVESGFPLFAAMHGRGHAIAVVGYEWRNYVNTPHTTIRHAWDEVQALAVVDDNHLPYRSIPVVGAPTTSNDPLYSANDIDAFIVSLPEKIFYPADAVDKVIAVLFKISATLPPQDKTIMRYFITTGSAFRKFVRSRESEMDPKLITTVMSLPFAQFIWVVEFSTDDQWAAGKVEARAIIDATASLREDLPFWLIHSRTEALVFDRLNVKDMTGIGTLKLANMGHTGFSRMDQNLRPTQPK